MTDAPIPDNVDRPNVVAAGDVAGVLWVTARHPWLPCLNGYVRLPVGHPWQGLDYDDIDVDVHGGLTFAHYGWIGFDTGHAFDQWPVADDAPEWQRSMFAGDASKYDIHWTPEKVAAEAQHLAEQVAAVMSAAQ